VFKNALWTALPTIFGQNALQDFAYTISISSEVRNPDPAEPPSVLGPCRHQFPLGSPAFTLILFYETTTAQGTSFNALQALDPSTSEMHCVTQEHHRKTYQEDECSQRRLYSRAACRPVQRPHLKTTHGVGVVIWSRRYRRLSIILIHAIRCRMLMPSPSFDTTSPFSSTTYVCPHHQCLF